MLAVQYGNPTHREIFEKPRSWNMYGDCINHLPPPTSERRINYGPKFLHIAIVSETIEGHSEGQGSERRTPIISPDKRTLPRLRRSILEWQWIVRSKRNQKVPLISCCNRLWPSPTNHTQTDGVADWTAIKLDSTSAWTVDPRHMMSSSFSTSCVTNPTEEDLWIWPVKVNRRTRIANLCSSNGLIVRHHWIPAKKMDNAVLN